MPKVPDSDLVSVHLMRSPSGSVVDAACTLAPLAGAAGGWRGSTLALDDGDTVAVATSSMGDSASPGPAAALLASATCLVGGSEGLGATAGAPAAELRTDGFGATGGGSTRAGWGSGGGGETTGSGSFFFLFFVAVEKRRDDLSGFSGDVTLDGFSPFSPAVELSSLVMDDLLFFFDPRRLPRKDRLCLSATAVLPFLRWLALSTTGSGGAGAA
mmetsp:Transcript_15063/g.38691  ORF Transcript_15063/g.38691 Transcript_15063/m.38691 type:complete len:214 (-) Transcript_15063:3629-4270(-)